MSLILTNVFYGGEILHTPYGVDYNMNAACTVVVTDNTNIVELQSQIYRGLNLIPSQFNLSVKARINKAQDGTYKYSLFCVDNEQIWDVIKSMAPSVGQYRTLELIVEAEPIVTNAGTSSYDPTPQVPVTPEVAVTAEEVGDQEENEEIPSTWHLDEEEDDDVENDENEGYETPEEDTREVERILSEWRKSVPFINRGMKHPCPSFNDDSEGPYADDPYYRKPRRLDEEFGEGQIFQTKKDLIGKLASFHISRNMAIEVKKSNKSMYVVECKNEICPWRLYARVTDSGVWMISTNPLEHCCYGSATRTDHGQMTSHVIADIIKPGLRENLEMSVKEVRNLVKSKFPTIEPSYNKLWRGREQAIADLFGSWENSYELLPSLLDAIKRTTPGTKFLIEREPSDRFGVDIFNRAAWAFGPSIQAWPHLRPVITIDAGFLSGRYKGKLFAACGYDAEQHIVPLAFAIAEEEDLYTWGWFMSWLRQAVLDERRITVISDQHAAIKAVFAQQNLGWCEAEGEAVHRYCTQHVAENLYRAHPTRRLKNVFKQAVRHKKVWRFEEMMQRLKGMKKEAYEYVTRVGAVRKVTNSATTQPIPEAEQWEYHFEKWAQCYDGGLHRWGIMTSNGSESLNNVFRVARQLPVCALVEKTFYKSVEWFHQRRKMAAEWQERNLQFPQK